MHTKNHIVFFLFSVGAVDYKTDISEEDIDDALQYCEFQRPSGCMEDFDRMCTNRMHQNGKTCPNDHHEALQLFNWLFANVVA